MLMDTSINRFPSSRASSPSIKFRLSLLFSPASIVAFPVGLLWCRRSRFGGFPHRIHLSLFPSHTLVCERSALRGERAVYVFLQSFCDAVDRRGVFPVASLAPPSSLLKVKPSAVTGVLCPLSVGRELGRDPKNDNESYRRSLKSTGQEGELFFSPVLTLFISLVVCNDSRPAPVFPSHWR